MAASLLAFGAGNPSIRSSLRPSTNDTGSLSPVGLSTGCESWLPFVTRISFTRPASLPVTETTKSMLGVVTACGGGSTLSSALRLVPGISQKKAAHVLFILPLRVAVNVITFTPAGGRWGRVHANRPSSPTFTGRTVGSEAGGELSAVRTTSGRALPCSTIDTWGTNRGGGSSSSKRTQSGALLVPTRCHPLPFQHSQANCKSGEGRTPVVDGRRCEFAMSMSSCTVAPVEARP